MEFVRNLDISIPAPSISVAGVASAYIIDNCVLRETYYVRHETAHGILMPVAVLTLDWTIPAWVKARVDFAKISSAIEIAGWPLEVQRAVQRLTGTH